MTWTLYMGFRFIQVSPLIASLRIFVAMLHPHYIVILHLAWISWTEMIICIIGRNSFVTIATFYLVCLLAWLVFTSVSIEAERYNPCFFSPRARHFIFKQWHVKLGIKLQENNASLLASACRTSLSPFGFFGILIKASFFWTKLHRMHIPVSLFFYCWEF